MGTENAAPLLHALVRMTRPRRVLEVGLGYTTLFLLDALAKAARDHREDRALVRGGAKSARRSVLDERAVDTDYAPLLIGIDDFSLAGSSAEKTAAAAERLGLAGLMKLAPGDFRDAIPKIARSDLPFDLIWFDCGGPADYADFLALCWPLLSANYGLLALHFTYWPKTAASAKPATFLLPGAILNEIKRQEARQADKARFEVLSLLEPYKIRQGSVTLIRKLPPQDRLRDEAFGEAPFDLGKG